LRRCSIGSGQGALQEIGNTQSGGALSQIVQIEPIALNLNHPQNITPLPVGHFAAETIPFQHRDVGDVVAVAQLLHQERYMLRANIGYKITVKRCPRKAMKGAS